VRKRPQRRSRPTLRARIGTFWVLGLIVIAAVLWGGWTLATLPAFALHSLAINGLDHVSRDDVAARAALDPQANIWLLDTHAIERRVEAVPYVDTARVHRRPLGAVSIDVTERAVDGCLRDVAGNEFTIDRKRRVLERGCSPAAASTYTVRARIGTPPGGVVENEELAKLQDDVRALATTKHRFRAVAHDAFGQLEATMQDGIRVKFGDDGDLERKQRLIGPILAQLGPRATDVQAVDLRAPATPVVEYRH